jgi:hypothetical protein
VKSFFKCNAGRYGRACEYGGGGAANRNFGFNLPWWDRLFGTYCAQPSAGHEHMKIGIEIFREPKELRLDRMLLQPFRGDARAGGYPVGSRQKASE